MATDSNACGYKMVVNGLKGRTLVATRDFTIGEVVVDELPLCVLTDASVVEGMREITMWRQRHNVDLVSHANLRNALYLAIHLDSKTAARAKANLFHEPPSEWCITHTTNSDVVIRMLQKASMLTSQQAADASCYVKLLTLNAFAIVDAGGRAGYGNDSALYVTASHFCHSCAPNCAYQAMSPAWKSRMVVRAQRTIRAGEELTVSYLTPSELLHTTIARKRLLQNTKAFNCLCERCVGPCTAYASLCRSCGGRVVTRLDSAKMQCIDCIESPSLDILLKCCRAVLDFEREMKTFCSAVEAIIKLSDDGRLTAEASGMAAARRIEIARNLMREYLHPSHTIFQQYHRSRVDVFGMIGKYALQVAAIREMSDYYDLVLGPAPSMILSVPLSTILSVPPSMILSVPFTTPSASHSPSLSSSSSTSSTSSSSSSISPSSSSASPTSSVTMNNSGSVADSVTSETKLISRKCGSATSISTVRYQHVTTLCLLTAALFRVGTLESLAESQQCSFRAIQLEAIRAGTQRIEYNELLASHAHITSALHNARLVTINIVAPPTSLHSRLNTLA